MRRTILAAAVLGILGYMATAAQGQGQGPFHDETGCKVGAENGGCADGCGHHHSLWDWLTYHPLPTSSGCCQGGCHTCRPVCTPHLYEWFLWESPGCGHGGCGHGGCGCGPVGHPAGAVLMTDQPTSAGESTMPHTQQR
jgi:hypothetical protein